MWIWVKPVLVGAGRRRAGGRRSLVALFIIFEPRGRGVQEEALFVHGACVRFVIPNKRDV